MSSEKHEFLWEPQDTFGERKIQLQMQPLALNMDQVIEEEAKESSINVSKELGSMSKSRNQDSEAQEMHCLKNLLINSSSDRIPLSSS